MGGNFTTREIWTGIDHVADVFLFWNIWKYPCDRNSNTTYQGPDRKSKSQAL